MSTLDDAGPVRRRVAKIGLVAVTSIVMGNMIGAGIFTIPNQIGKYGAWGIAAFCLTAMGAVILGLTFASLARKVPKTGGPYAYTRAAFGDFAGYWLAWGYWIGLWTGQVAIACVFSNYVGVFIPIFRESMLWNGVLAFTVLWAVTGLNLRGTKTAGGVAIITTIIRVLPLLAIATAGWFYFKPENYAATLPEGTSALGALGAAATITMFSFLGLESGTVPAGGVKDPSKTIPRATIIGILAVAALYIASTAVVLGVVPAERLGEDGIAFADAGRSMWGGAGYYAVAVAGVVSTLGALSGFTLLNGQVPMAAAVDRLFPKSFSLTNRHHAPWFGLIASGVLISIFMLIGYGALLAGKSDGNGGLQHISIVIATVTTVLPYAFCAIAEIILILNKREFPGKRIAKLCVIPALAFAYSLYVIYGAGSLQIAIGFFLSVLGLPVYIIVHKRLMRAREEADGDRKRQAEAIQESTGPAPAD